VAIKEISLSMEASKIDDVWNHEAEMLRYSNSLSDKHLLKCIAAVRRGDKRYLSTSEQKRNQLSVSMKLRMKTKQNT
jgi:hypothetical protein